VLAEEKDLPFALTAEERALAYVGLSRKYLEAGTQEALDAGYDHDPVNAMRGFDRQTPGEWLQSRWASKGATELLTTGFGMDFGPAVSFILHGLNRRGSSASYKIDGGNELLPQAFAKRASIRYATPVMSVTQSDREVQVTVRNGRGPETLTADRVVCTLPCPVIGRISRRHGFRTRSSGPSANSFIRGR
jgi:hypothetical protein